MYYKILKSSPTGQQLAAICERMTEANDRALKLVESFGAETFRPGHWTIGGGISSIIFPEGKPEKSELKHWKTGAQKGEYLPSERTQKGKQMGQLIEALPRVFRNELNQIVGYSHKWNVVGILWNKGRDYFLISFMEHWEYSVTPDCIEITHSEYKELGKKLKEKEVESD